MNTKTTFRPRTVGLLVTALLAAGLFSGCGPKGPRREVRQHDADRTFQVIVVDSCEYLYRVYGYQGYMAHKGNCRFCTARRTPCR